MSKFIKNILKLISINTPIYIILNLVKNFFPNYKTKKKSLIIEKEIYDNFISYKENQKWFCNNLYFLKSNLKNRKNINNILEIGSYEGRSAIFFLNCFSNSIITCVDTWGGSDEQKDLDSKIIEKNFDTNLSKHHKLNRMKKFKMTSNKFFDKNKSNFDLVQKSGLTPRFTFLQWGEKKQLGKWWIHVLVAYWLLVSSIVLLNLFIALMSDTFQVSAPLLNNNNCSPGIAINQKKKGGFFLK